MANTFNPEANLPNAQDFTNASKGFTDNGLGTFVGGIAEDLDTGLKAIDRGVAAKANDEVRSAVEDTDAQLLGIKNQGPAEDPLRREIKDQVQNLADKKLAMDAGTIDPQHYYATIQAKVKDIRARYSGYNDQIDDDLKQLGIDPNWQRREIIEEGLKAQAAARGSAAEAAKNAREFTEAAINNKSAVIPPEFRAKMADPNFSTDPNNIRQLKLYLLQSNDLYSRMEIQKARAEFDAANGKGQATDLGTAYGNSLNTIFYVASKNGGAYDLVKKAQEKIDQDARMGGGAVPTEDIDNLRNAYRSFRSQMEAGRMQVKASFSDSASLFTDEMKKQDAAFTSILDDIDKSISNKDWGGLSTNLAHVEATIAGARSRQLDNSEFIQSQSATRANIGDQSASMVFARNLKESSDAITADGKNALARDQINGRSKSLVEDMKRFRTDVPNAKPKDFRDIFNNSIDLILHPEGKPTGRLNVFEATFGEENQGFWDNIMNNGKLSNDDKRAYFRILTSPEMQKAVNELSASDPRANTKLYQYTQYMFAKLNQDSPADINNTIRTSSGSTIKYDPTTHHLSIEARDNPGSTTAGRILDTTLGATTAVQNWNDGMDALVPMWKRQGLDPNQMAPELMRKMNIDIDGVFIGNPLDNIVNKIAPPRQGENFSGPRGSATTNTDGRGGVPDFDLSKAPSGFNPRGSSTATTSNTVGDFLRNLDFNANKKAAGGSNVEPSKLGGTGATGGDSLPAFGGPGFAHAVNTRNQPNAFQASGQELKELYDAASKAKDDPELRSIIMQHIKAITKDLPNNDGAPKSQSSFQPENMNTKDGRMEPGLSSPDATALDTATSYVPGVSLAKVLQDPKATPKDVAMEAGMTALQFLPFGKAMDYLEKIGMGKVFSGMTLKDLLAKPGKYDGSFRIPEVGERETVNSILEDIRKGISPEELRTKYKITNQGIARRNIVEDNGNNVVSNTTLEARRAAKGLDQEAAAREQSVKDELTKLIEQGRRDKGSLTPAEETARASALKTADRMELEQRLSNQIKTKSETDLADRLHEIVDTIHTKTPEQQQALRLEKRLVNQELDRRNQEFLTRLKNQPKKDAKPRLRVIEGGKKE